MAVAGLAISRGVGVGEVDLAAKVVGGAALPIAGADGADWQGVLASGRVGGLVRKGRVRCEDAVGERAGGACRERQFVSGGSEEAGPVGLAGARDTILGLSPDIALQTEVQVVDREARQASGKSGHQARRSPERE